MSFEEEKSLVLKALATTWKSKGTDCTAISAVWERQPMESDFLYILADDVLGNGEHEVPIFGLRSPYTIRFAQEVLKYDAPEAVFDKVYSALKLDK